MNQLRKQRWSRAFSESQTGATASEINDARATVVIEHIMQASGKSTPVFLFEVMAVYCVD